ncbi:IS3 family transposase, partial [Bacillus sp. V3B]
MKMRKKENPNQELEECIQSLFEEHDGNYGYRRIRLDLKQH